jgi:heme O synthase-like polyprenyltransferase
MRYSEEYELAGFPCITRKMTKYQIGRLVFSWVLGSALAAIFLFTFEIISNPVIIAALFSATILLVLLFKGLVKGREMNQGYEKYPVILNLYFLTIILLLISDRVI